ncbi:TAXI family TRAP transporter solute-binding subunit [Desertibaculum subflavum]|uniref:TAXI family TRAP transporter solute-binding subunit n=1 Tax=Desertibaculum subflavum TaxID=2268458 RepID=UPI000E66F60E
MRVVIAVGAALLASTTGAFAQDLKLPKQLSWTAYDTGSSGFNIAVAVGQPFKKYGTDVRVLPAGNDTARLAPLRSGRSVVSAMGVGVYFAQEGLFEFGSKEWGPQPVRVMLASTSCNGLTLGVAGDVGVKEVKDLKGKRVAAVVGSPALTQNAYAILAFGGLTPKDVKIVEFSSNNAMWKGMINGEVDAAFTSTISGQSKEMETSPRGIVWPPAPKSDTAGWDRLKKVAPFFKPHVATCGAAGLKEKPVEMPTYPYPIFTAYASQPNELIHAITKAMIVEYDNYKAAAPGADGLEVKRQDLEWAVPYHPGTVQALKEAGAWTPAAEAHNQKLVKRQEVLATAWKAYNDGKPAEDAYAAGWLKARADALKKAGMDPVTE